MNDMFWHLLAYSTAGLGLTLCLRKPARRLFGASPAFTLWLLPLIFCLLPCLPDGTMTMVIPPLHALPDRLSSITTQMPPRIVDFRWGALWLAGALVTLIRLASHYVRLRRECRPWTSSLPELEGFAIERVRISPHGPALLWAMRPLLLLPADFTHRFDIAERRCVLRHELTHLRRGDAWWNLLAECQLAMLWFHPLAWLALPRFRLDQELACDERSLRDAPDQRAQYAHTLLHSAGVAVTPAIIPWLNQPQLKERLVMIQQVALGVSRRRLGYFVLGLLMAACAMTAQAAGQHASSPAAADVEANLKLAAPTYPQEALTNKEQGLIWLKVQVDQTGKPGKIDFDAERSTTTSTALIQAASDAAAHWRFKPAMRDGQPIVSWVRIPVQFDLNPKSNKTPVSSNS
ncbi:TonB family protein [Dyella sp.]|uniref:M56 family metallopeptidase n=1 Tax=Dyella sp. TaxID=1869338 RepID=UPI002ED128CE